MIGEPAPRNGRPGLLRVLRFHRSASHDRAWFGSFPAGQGGAETALDHYDCFETIARTWYFRRSTHCFFLS